MTPAAMKDGTLDFDYNDPESNVELCPRGTDAWVNARVWVPQKWLKAKRSAPRK